MNEPVSKDALGIPRTCVNCGYRRGSVKYGVCLLSGKYPDMTRTFNKDLCNANFSGWIPRPGLLRRFLSWLWSLA